MTAASDTQHILVLTTVPSVAVARALVRRLVEARLVACGTVLPESTSLYRWEGAIEDATEVQVLLKTRRDRWDALAAAVRQHHPYDVPELLALPILAGLPAYLDWVSGEATPAQGAA